MTWAGTSIKLTPDIIREKFERIFRQPLEETERVLKDFSPEHRRRTAARKASNAAKEPPPPAPCVVVAGGSSRYKPLRARIQALCYENGIQPPIFEKDLTWTQRFS